MNRKPSQSQRHMNFQGQQGPRHGSMKTSQSSQNFSQNFDRDHDYEAPQFSGPRYDRQDMSLDKSPSFRDTDYDLDGSTYGNQDRYSRNMEGSGYGHSDYETNDRNRTPSRYSSLDDDRYSPSERNFSDRSFNRQGSSSERFGYPSNMNAWSGSDRSYNSGKTSGRFGQGQWTGSDMDVHSYGRAGSASFGSFGEGSLGSEYGSDRMDRSSQGSQRGFFGKGPKGYKRSDDRIKEDVCETLARHPRVDASDIEVTVEDTVVTLSGTVESKEIRRAAEMAIENLSGVDDVKNELKVKKAGERGLDPSFSASSVNSGAESRSTVSTGTRSSKNSGHI